MNETAKITLSVDEQQLVCNTNWILTKHVIIEKVYKLLGNVLEEMKQEVESEKKWLPGDIFIPSPKIYKGENYRQLPYVLLDYPRCFEKESAVAIRSLFWWGNFFSIQLQVSGKYKVAVADKLLLHFGLLQQHEYFICINENQWEHHFEPDNFIEINGLSLTEFETILDRFDYIKIARKISIEEWDGVPGFLNNTFKEMIGFLKFG